MSFDYNTIDEVFEAIFECEMDINGSTVNPSIVPASGTIEIISDEMEVAQIEVSRDGKVIAFDHYCA